MSDRMSTMGEKDLFEIDRSVIYSKEKGYGYLELTKGITKCDGEYLPVSETDSVIALKNGGWNVRRLTEAACRNGIGSIAASNAACRVKKDCMLYRNIDLYRIDVPEEGTYRVELSIHTGKERLENLSVFAGRRNLIDYGISIDAGEKYTKTFYQAVTPYIPPLCSEPVIDMGIFISIATADNNSFDKKHEQLSDLYRISVKVTREDVPVLWIAGDSTLTDQNAGVPYYTYGSCAGWAQTLARFIDKAAVCNLAHSGMTTNCFRDDGHFDIVKEMVKPGDLFIMQFGHNDQKRRNLAAYGGYADNLRRYVKEIRALGAEPIICSPISRIPGELPKTKDSSESDDAKNTKFYSLLESHASACKEVAQELDVTFVDLHKMTFDKWVSDIEASHDFFMPGDITHTNEYGAVLISEYFIEEIRIAAQSSPSAKRIAQFDNHRQFTALLPDPDARILPKELPGPDIFSIEPPYVDIKGIPGDEGIKKAFRYGLLDPCVMHLHPYAPMPRAQLLMLLFRAFGKAGVRPYKGYFNDIFFDEWDSGYVQALVDMDTPDAKMERSEIENSETVSTDNMNQKTCSFRPDDMLTYEEFADFITKFAGLNPQLFGDILRASSEEASKKTFHILKKLGAVRDEAALSNVQEPYGTAEENEVTRQEVYTVLANIMEMRGQASKNLPSDSEVHPVH